MGYFEKNLEKSLEILKNCFGNTFKKCRKIYKTFRGVSQETRNILGKF